MKPMILLFSKSRKFGLTVIGKCMSEMWDMIILYTFIKTSFLLSEQVFLMVVFGFKEGNILV